MLYSRLAEAYKLVKICFQYRKQSGRRLDDVNTLVLVEIVIGILLAAGIAFAALRTFIKGKDNRPGLLIGSSAVAVVLLVVCLVCTGLQMNRLSSEEPETEVEELAQVRAESVVKKEEKTTAEMENTSAQQEEADKAKKEKAAEREEQAEREKKSADLLADFFGGSSKKTEEETEAADNKTVQADYGNINAAAFTVGVPVYSADEEDDTWDEVTYDDTEPVYELEYEQDDVYSGDSDASDNLLAEFFGGSVNSDDDYTSEYGGYDDYSAEEDPYDYSWYETPSDQDDSSYGSYDEQDYYDYSEYVNDYRQDYPFRMLAKGDKLKDGLRMRIKVRHIQSGNYGAGGPHNVEDDVPCEIYGGIFFCHWYCLATKIHSDLDKYYLVFRAEGDDIKWKNPGTSNIYEGSHHNFRIKELKSIQYKESIKSYEFSLDINYSGSVAYDNIPIIMDIYINKKNTYAYCPVDKTNLGNIICTTSEIEYKKTNVIAFKSFNYLGNSDITGISDNQALIGGEYYFIQIKYSN